MERLVTYMDMIIYVDVIVSIRVICVEKIISKNNNLLFIPLNLSFIILYF